MKRALVGMGLDVKILCKNNNCKNYRQHYDLEDCGVCNCKSIDIDKSGKCVGFVRKPEKLSELAEAFGLSDQKLKSKIPFSVYN